MPDVFCCRGVNSVLGDVGRVVTNAFKTARDQDQVQIARQLVTVLHHSFGRLPVCSDIHVVESLVSTNDCSRELDIFPHERVMLSLNIDIAWAWMGTIKFTSLPNIERVADEATNPPPALDQMQPVGSGAKFRDRFYQFAPLIDQLLRHRQ